MRTFFISEFLGMLVTYLMRARSLSSLCCYKSLTVLYIFFPQAENKRFEITTIFLRQKYSSVNTIRSFTQ